MKKIQKTAVVGAGNMGTNHIRILREISDLVGVVETDASKRNRLSSELSIKTYPTITHLLQQSHPDAITIAIPTEQHVNAALTTLKAGISTLIEKPLADQANAASQMIESAKKYGTYLLVGHVERFNPAVIALKEAIDHGKIGSITNLISVRVGILPPNNISADVSTDLAIHDIDIFNYLMGMTPKEHSIHKKQSLNHNLADTVSMVLEYPAATGVILASWMTPIKLRKLTVIGTKGALEVDYIQQTLHQTRPIPKIGPVNSFYDVVSKYQAPYSQLPVNRSEPLVNELEYFLKNSANTGPDPMCTDALEALKIAIG